MLKNGRLINNRLSIPPSLMKYFVKKDNRYEDVESRVYKRKSEYSPTNTNKYRKKIGFSDRI